MDVKFPRTAETLATYAITKKYGDGSVTTTFDCFGGEPATFKFSTPEVRKQFRALVRHFEAAMYQVFKSETP
jgi:hypothetical protein